MKVICIDGDFTDFKKLNGNRFNLPIEGKSYEVRAVNKHGGYMLDGLTNPYFCISMNPLLFEELHFKPERFLVLDDAPRIEPPYLIHYN